MGKKLTKIIALSTLGVSLLASGCGKDDDKVEITKQEETYNLYVKYMKAKGDTPLSYEEWLTSIKGEKGDPGDNGEDGHTPEITIGENGNWFVDGVDTEVKAQGDKGDDAIAPQVRINQVTNYWEISTDNGTTWTSTGVKATGENGQDHVAKEVTITYDFNLVHYNLVNEIQNNNLFVKEGFEIGELYWKPSYLVFKMTQKSTKGDYFNLYDYFDEIGIGEYFDGWYYNDTKVTDINVVGGDIELEAKWKKNFAEFVSYNDVRIGYIYDEDSLTATAYPASENATMDLKALTIKDGKFYDVVDFSIHKDGGEEGEVYAKTVYLSDSLYPFIYTNGQHFLPRPGTNSPSVEYAVRDYYIDEENDIRTHAVHRIVIVKSPSYNHTNHPIEYIYLVDYETNTARLIDTWRAPGYNIEDNARPLLGNIPLKFNVKIDGEIKEIKVDYLSHSWFDPDNHIKYNSDAPINNYMGFIVDSEDEEIIVSGISIKYYEEHYDFALFFKGNVRLDDSSSTSFGVFYYSETEPTEPGNYWHYDRGTPVIWGSE